VSRIEYTPADRAPLVALRRTASELGWAKPWPQQFKGLQNDWLLVRVERDRADNLIWCDYIGLGAATLRVFND
jgi:hypothetical protein